MSVLETSALSLGAAEEWERCITKTKPSPSNTKPKKADKSELIEKDGETLVSMVLDQPLEAKALVEDPDRLISEITATLKSKQAHSLLNQW